MFKIIILQKHFNFTIMKTEIKYIELKSGFSDNGPAWIALVSFSKSGKTVYFDGKAFQSTKGDRTGGNYFDIETGDEYWISGVKKDLTDRHWAGGGIIGIEKRIQEDYLKLIDCKAIHPAKHKITEVSTEIPLEKFHELENEKVKFENSKNETNITSL